MLVVTTTVSQCFGWIDELSVVYEYSLFFLWIIFWMKTYLKIKHNSGALTYYVISSDHEYKYSQSYMAIEYLTYTLMTRTCKMSWIIHILFQYFVLRLTIKRKEKKYFGQLRIKASKVQRCYMSNVFFTLKYKVDAKQYTFLELW